MKIVRLATALALSMPALAMAGPRHAVAPLPGLACMSLNMTQQQAMDPAFVVPLHASPDPSSPSVGEAGAIVLVRNPLIQEKSFVAAVLFSGKAGWIAASDVKPWVDPGGHGRNCVPSRMSDGSIGFAFR